MPRFFKFFLLFAFAALSGPISAQNSDIKGTWTAELRNGARSSRSGRRLPGTGPATAGMATGTWASRFRSTSCRPPGE